ncbi:MAG: MaoC family dehydratase [Proteobacteria bacterium]|nr:MaoC family dehydratase [Pseudomonadota bacterium]
MNSSRLSPAALADHVGQEIGTSSWITIDQPRVDTFADCTEDRQWIHVDVERAAKESPYRGTVAHGFLTLALLAPTAFDVLLSRVDARQAVNYGLEKVRFVAPVRTGKRVRNHVKVAAVEVKDGGRVLLTTENTFEIEGEDKPALVAVSLAMLMA